MPSKFRHRLLAHLRHPSYEPSHVARLATDLGVDDPKEFAQAVQQMQEAGQVQIDDRGIVTLPSLGGIGGELVGKFDRHAKGFGFVRPQQYTLQEGSLFIPPEETLDAMSGDIVRATIERQSRGRHGRAGAKSGKSDSKEFRGRIVEIIERRQGRFSGEIEKRGSQWLVFMDRRDFSGPIVVRDAESKNVKPGDKVVLELTHFPEGDTLGEGVIVDVLGEAGRPDVETAAVIAQYDLPGEFPSACIDQAREATAKFDEDVEKFIAGDKEIRAFRRDLTEDFILTIDPPDAKDYDDAISIERTKNGWRLGVHIADVAHFVEPGTPLDEEAKQRGTSVYLPRLVIPMLPEVLSNGICSLQEGVHRFSKSLFMEYDKRGHCTARGAAQTVIKSRKRLTYLEAQALIDGDPEEAKKHAKTEANYTDELVSQLKEMDALAKAIRRRRHEQGMISLDLPEAELIFDENGRVVDAEPEDDAFTHTLIEMFMVEANETIAILFEDMNVPLIRRIHPEPVPGDIEGLRQVAMVSGYRIPKSPTREELQGLLDSTRGKPVARAVHMAVLRTLTKAEYSPALVGHFALASEAYAHFTSPIRRYPDLTAHRALWAWLQRTDNGTNRPRDEKAQLALARELLDDPLCPPEDELSKVAHHCSMTEQNAEDAERELRKFLVLQLLETKIGEAYDGVVTGVTPRGIFVQIDKYLIDGFINKSDLPGDVTRSNQRPFWKIDSKSGALVDQNSGRSYSMGDMLRVLIAKVDLVRRELDLQIADAESRAAGKRKITLGGEGGGLEGGGGAGFGKQMTGSQRRSRKSKSRDKGKTDYRRDKKKRK